MGVEITGGPASVSARLLRATAGVLCLLVCAAAAVETRGQDAALPQNDSAPPPMKYLPDEARRRLASVSDAKERTRLSIELAEARLASAEQLTASERYESAGGELAVYQAIIGDATRHLQVASTSKNKHRDTSKRLEITLRSHVPRIETIRRTTPAGHAVHVRAALEFVRDARSECLNAFYDDTVLPEGRGGGREKSGGSGGGDRAKDTSRMPPEKKPDQKQ